MTETTQNKQYTLEEVDEIARIAVVLGQSAVGIVRYGYTAPAQDNVLRSMHKYQNIFTPIVSFLEEDKRVKGKGLATFL